MSVSHADESCALLPPQHDILLHYVSTAQFEQLQARCLSSCLDSAITTCNISKAINSPTLAFNRPSTVVADLFNFEAREHRLRKRRVCEVATLRCPSCKLECRSLFLTASCVVDSSA